MCYTSVCRVWLSVVSVYGAVAANDLVAWRGGERWSVGDVQSKLAAAFKEPDEWGPGTVIDIC